jgi:hypothetical protein
MKRRLCLVCGALVGMTILHFTAAAETARSSSSSAAPAASLARHEANGQSSRNLEQECEDEWRADKEAMMQRDMTEDRYVEQCRVKDDVPAVPTKNAAPFAAPNRSLGR